MNPKIPNPKIYLGLVIMWIFCSGLNFWAFCVNEGSFRFVSLAFVVFCVWRLFACLRRYNLLSELKKELEEKT